MAPNTQDPTHRWREFLRLVIACAGLMAYLPEAYKTLDRGYVRCQFVQQRSP